MHVGFLDSIIITAEVIIVVVVNDRRYRLPIKWVEQRAVGVDDDETKQVGERGIDLKALVHNIIMFVLVTR